MWKLTINDHNTVKILNAFNLFIDDFLSCSLALDPSHPNLSDEISKINSPLGNVAKRTKVGELLIKFVQCSERYLIYFLYKNYCESYSNIINGLPYLIVNFSKDSKELIKEAFEYFYELLLDTKEFQINYLVGYDGSKELKREVRKLIGHESVCPYCDINEITHEDNSSIDHFLPKSKFPLLSIFSNNLIVACSACNDRIKLAKMSLPNIHPLYDTPSSYFRFMFTPKMNNLNLEYLVNNVEEYKAIDNFLSLFKIGERYNRLLHKLKRDRDIIRRNVKEKYLLVNKTPGQNLSLLNQLYQHEVSTYLNDNKEVMGGYCLTKLRMDFAYHLEQFGKDDDISYLCEELSLGVNEATKVY